MKKNFFLIILIIITLVILSKLFFFTNEYSKEPVLKSIEIKEKSFKLKQSNDIDNDYIEISTTILYPSELKGIISTETKMNENKTVIIEIFSKYFINLTKDDLKKEESLNEARNELKTQLNDFFMEENKVKEKMVYKLTFSQWLFK